MLVGLLKWLLAKNPPAMQEMWVQSQDWEGTLKKAMAIHSSIVAWEIPWTEETGQLESMRGAVTDSQT